ncbi:major facilitator superfamily domain-containing protein [Phascolomyces articulosus]|uniref:Major facilitator superfamily domain-containing protein n=1 Tax=Phascolomyces articulosus TaxID=60185 RepID=A0AAD5JM24_9FUNG|nr:major facilitator superfamily domain-containing protein [Phascolomyces articulosus]
MTPSVHSKFETVPIQQRTDIREIPIEDDTIRSQQIMNNNNDDNVDHSQEDERRQRWKSLLPHMLQTFYIQAVCGMQDANIGIILPSLQVHYGLTQYVVSIIFLCTTLGYFIAAFTNGYLIQKTSQAKTALIGGISLGLAYIAILFALPFPVMCCFMVPVGFGMALMQSCANVVCGEMPRGTIILNFLHAGALIAPLLAAAILERKKSWAVTYMILCGMQWANVLSMIIVFRKLKTRAEVELEEKQQTSSSPSLDDGHVVEGTQQHQENDNYNNGKMLATVIQSRIAYMAALFLLTYVGTEVTVGNWGYTFLITVRSTDTVAMAHFMSGYWGGICAGRLFLGYLSLRFGEKRMIYCYVGLIIGMLFVFWFVPVAGASAAALAIMGIALGPIYPSTVSLTNKVVSPQLFAITIGFISAFGSGGSALFPYITGVLIGSVGIRSVMPMCVAMAILMFVTWVFVPNPVGKKKITMKEEETDIHMETIRQTATTSGTGTILVNSRLHGNTTDH